VTITPHHPPIIELNKARLRPLQAADAEAIYSYLREPLVTELTSYPEITRSMVEGMLDKYEKRWAAGELSKWGLALDGDDQIVGLCGFNEWSKVHRWAEVAFDLAPAFWGRGLMRQALQALMFWTFAQDQIDRVHAYVRIDNGRSMRLLQRSGFVREGCLRKYRICRGQAYDYYVYSLLRSDWVIKQSSEATNPEKG
jgi:[ribosomal protein S5]-alanine N-acetyltransferase